MLAWPGRAWAEGRPSPSPHGRPAKDAPAPSGTKVAAIVSLRPLTGNLALADVSFKGSGVPSGGGPRERVSFKGRDAGYVSPFYVGGELGANVLVEHVSLALAFDFGRILESNAPTSRADVTSKIDGASAFLVGGAVGVGGYAWLGPALVRAEMFAGARRFLVDLKGYEDKVCRSKGRTWRCHEKASSTQAWLQPRLSLDAVVWRGEGADALVVGPWVGLEIAPALGLSAGLSVGLASLP
ncbi:MAG TPA: hypothetical protein VFS00_34255 [Polyangiaceae bacterium]|nr:hypothetical protein [Polyangiaceae bacterium]